MNINFTIIAGDPLALKVSNEAKLPSNAQVLFDRHLQTPDTISAIADANPTTRWLNGNPLGEEDTSWDVASLFINANSCTYSSNPHYRASSHTHLLTGPSPDDLQLVPLDAQSFVRLPPTCMIKLDEPWIKEWRTILYLLRTFQPTWRWCDGDTLDVIPGISRNIQKFIVTAEELSYSDSAAWRENEVTHHVLTKDGFLTATPI